jgi:glycosyl transferase family 25
MRAYVINLPRAQRRRRHIASELHKAGIEYRFIAAVDGRELSPDQFAERVDLDAVARHPRWLIPTALGAAMSHLEAYRQILADGDEAALVVEDDAGLPDRALQLLSEVQSELATSEIVLLYYRTMRPIEFSVYAAVSLEWGGRLMYPINPTGLNSATAYVVTRDACKRLTELMTPIWAGADSWSLFYDRGALERVRCVVPRPVIHRNDFKSTLDYHDPRSLAGRFSRLASNRWAVPLHAIVTWRRRSLENDMSRFSLSDNQSPMAQR